jgi:ribonuclease HII
VGATEIRFQTKAEAHFPVAVSSMVCKYTREVMMELFNQFWSEHVPDIKPTKGYPVDARRFKSEIAAAQAELEISDQILWRGQ